MRNPLIAGLLALPLLGLSLSAMAADPALGRWKTLDDKTGKAMTISEVYMAKNGMLSAKIVENLGLPPNCAECSGEYKDKPYVGIVTLWNLKQQKDGTYKTDKETFGATVARDGTVTITDKPNLQRQGLGAKFDVTDAAMRAQGIDPYASEKRRFLDRTRYARWRELLHGPGVRHADDRESGAQGRMRRRIRLRPCRRKSEIAIT